jgi:hypothetical protein
MIARVKPEGMLSENRRPPRIKGGAGFFRIMRENILLSRLRST